MDEGVDGYGVDDDEDDEARCSGLHDQRHDGVDALIMFPPSRFLSRVRFPYYFCMVESHCS